MSDSNEKWTNRFLDLAMSVSGWSKDPSTQVGAVIVDHARRILGIGYNGFPRGVSDDPERYAEKSVKYAMIVHAEANAILNAAGRTLTGTTIYTTKFPCSECVKLLVQSGIDTVVCPEPSLDGKWADDSMIAKQMLTETCVEVTYVRLPRVVITPTENWIGVDLDRTLAIRNSGDPIGTIGAPIQSMVDRIQLWLAADKRVKIFTARVASCHADREEQRQMISDWSYRVIGVRLEVTSEKDHMMSALWDDLAMMVEPNTGLTVRDAADEVINVWERYAVAECGTPDEYAEMNIALDKLRRFIE